MVQKDRSKLEKVDSKMKASLMQLIHSFDELDCLVANLLLPKLGNLCGLNLAQNILIITT